MTKPTDDLEAVRVIVEAVDGFETDDKERIIRWALEKLKLPNVKSPLPHLAAPPVQPAIAPHPASTPKNLRSFVEEKQPKSDIQFAATVAFYHRFEAPLEQRKDNINPDDLKNACRLVNRERLKKPLQTLNNARNLGLLDSAGRGLFTINSVGENLVAMTLPAAPGNASRAQHNKRAKGSGRTNKKNARARQ
jgi:hypothetical protein